MKRLFALCIYFSVMFSKIYIKHLLPSLSKQRLSYYFGNGKLPFEKKDGRSSPFQKRPSGNQWIKRPQKKTETVEVKESAKETIVQAQTIKEKVTPKVQPVKYDSSPIQKQRPRQQTEVDPKIQSPPLDFQPFIRNQPSESVIGQQPDLQKKEQTVNDVIMSNIGLNRYLTRIYVTSGLSLMISLASAYACFFLPNFVEAADTLLFVGGIISFFSFKVAQQIRPTFYEEKINEGMIYRTKNDWDRLAIYGMGCIGMGIATSPIFLAISGAGGAIIPMTMGVTAAIFGGASLVGLYLPKNTLLGYRSALKGSLIGLIGLNATGLLAAQIFGISLFASTLTSFESYMGIGLFSLMLIYDTTVAISRYEKGDADHLGMSIHVLLNVLNLIVRIAIQIAKAKANSKSNDSEDKK